MRAYPTLYGGIEYRSRLEARWAAFFTEIGWRTTYEPFDGDAYIPDFLIDGAEPLLVEIKPATLLADYGDAVPKIEHGLRGNWQHDVLILGLSPLPGGLDATAAADSEFHPAAGVLGEFGGEWPGGWLEGSETAGAKSGWSWDTGVWFTCAKCGGIGVYHQIQSWKGRPCGHYDGDHLLGHINNSLLEDHWASACNDVKWHGRSV
ncbi:hypothetical protein VXE65_32590 [Mycolicibacterium conceptionense]|uniref:hypothetical protein n=1 Tax=Mycolicibacterium conceptionense TaxID=451644 RepID=UPI0032046549